MKTVCACLLGGLVFSVQYALAQDGSLTLPKTVEAGSAFSIPTRGSGKATLYIVGLGQVLRRDVQLGEVISIPTGKLYSAGHYVTVLVCESSPAESGSF